MFKYNLTIIILLFSLISFGQSFQLRNKSQGSNIAIDAVQLPNQNYIIGGIYSNDLGSGTCLLNIDARGNVEWSKKSISQNKLECVDMIQDTFTGSIYMLMTDISLDEDPISTFTVLKLNEEGNTIWAKTMETDNRDVLPRVITLLNDGNILVSAGIYTDDKESILLLKVGEEGNLIWKKEIGNEYTNRATSVCELPSGKLCLYGRTETAVSGLQYDAFIMLLDDNGVISKSKRIYSGYTEFGGSVIYYPIDNTLCIASTAKDMTELHTDIFVSFFDTQLNSLWTKKYSGEEFDYAQELSIDSWGNMHIGGTTASFGNGGLELLHMKLDPEGNYLQINTIGGEGKEMTNKSIHTKDNGLLVTGYTRSFDANGLDSYIVKMNSRGIGYCNHTSNTEMPISYFEYQLFDDNQLAEMNNYQVELRPININWENYDFEIENICSESEDEEDDSNNSFLVAETIDESEVSISLSSNELIISLRDKESSINEIQVYDISGRIVYQRTNMPHSGVNSMKFNDVDLNTGIYIVSLIYENNQIKSTKINLD